MSDPAASVVTASDPRFPAIKAKLAAGRDGSKLTQQDKAVAKEYIAQRQDRQRAKEQEKLAEEALHRAGFKGPVFAGGRGAPAASEGSLSIAPNARLQDVDPSILQREFERLKPLYATYKAAQDQPQEKPPTDAAKREERVGLNRKTQALRQEMAAASEGFQKAVAAAVEADVRLRSVGIQYLEHMARVRNSQENNWMEE